MSPWQPDQGDGTYRNPVLYADYSDPDAIRVGEDYWLIASSFCHVPGLPILHSRDLVNWELVNHALPQLVPVDHFRTVRHGGGVWAPAIRFHAGKYWIYYPDPDFGIYVVTATDPRAAWSVPILVKAGKGLIDPCPFWDDDGQMYLVHGWARSRGPVSNRVSLCRLSADGVRPLEESRDIIDANKLEGWRTLEGPKMYKRNGYYYVFAPAGGVKEGYQAVFRARAIQGPYEWRIVMDQGTTAINGPHQGAWVDTPTGENWFLHFQDQYAYGRVVHLQPMSWSEDGWPAMGTAVANGQPKGEPLLTFRKPTAAATLISVPATSDEFRTPQLGRQWQWQANPESSWSSLTAHADYLRLQAVAIPEGGLYDAPNLLLQKFPAPEFTITTVLDGSALKPGSEAGAIVFGYSYAWIGLRRDTAGLALVQEFNHEHNVLQSPPLVPASGGIVQPIDTVRVFLRIKVGPDAKVRFAYSIDGKTFTSVGAEFVATVDRWVGAKIGLFATQKKIGPVSPEASFAEFASFVIE